MKAAVFNGPGDLQVLEIPTPRASTGDLVVKVGSNTVCGTDGRCYRGEKAMPTQVVMGHEIGATVVEVGSGVAGFSEGDNVSILPTVPCCRCYYCKRGLENLCIDAKVFGYNMGGGMAEYLHIPDYALDRGGIYRVDPSVPLTSISLAEPLGCVINGHDNYRVHVGDTVVIVGAGPIGLLHLQLAKLAGAAQLIVSELSPSRRETALKLGATHAVSPAEVDLRTYVLDHTEGVGADVAVICIGVTALVEEAMTCVRKQGRVNAFAGFPKGQKSSIEPNLIHYGELQVTGASNAGRVSHARAVELISSGAIDVASLITHTYPLDDVVAAIEFSSGGEGLKVAIVP